MASVCLLVSIVGSNLKNNTVCENNLTELPGPQFGVMSKYNIYDPNGIVEIERKTICTIPEIQSKENRAIKDSGENKEENLIETTLISDTTPLEYDTNDGYVSIPYTEDELMLLAKLVYAEAGSTWLSDEHQCLVASVVKNRVLDSRFPNSIYGVISQPGQYSPYINGYLYSQTPDQRTIDNCRKVLDGDFYCDTSVVWQSGCVQGIGIYKSIYDATLNTTTYFCY